MRPPPIIVVTALAGSALGLGLALLPQDFDQPAAVPPEDRVARNAPQTSANSPAEPPELTFDRRFQSCAHCHQIGPGARNSSGPTLTGLLGRKAASADYPYSKAMRESGVVWDEPTLRAFLKSPQAVVPGTRMAFGGMDDGKIDQLIEFLKTAR